MVNDYSLEVGDSFELINGYGIHLHIIIAAESEASYSQVIIVYISSTETIYKDFTTIIKPGEHEYITRTDVDSWVRYQNSILCSRSAILPEITKHYGKISNALLTRIQNGFLESKNVPTYMKRTLREWKINKLYDSI